MRTNGIVYLTKKVEFSASHRYYQPKLSAAQNKKVFGKCAWPNGHGHNYILEVTVAGSVNSLTGMVMNIKQLKRFLQKVVQRLDHRYLNRDLPQFKRLVPTTENIARVLWRILQEQYPRLPLHKIRLTEGEEVCVEYYGR